MNLASCSLSSAASINHQSAEELAYNVILQYVYNSIVHGEGNHQYPMPVCSAGPLAGPDAR